MNRRILLLWLSLLGLAACSSSMTPTVQPTAKPTTPPTPQIINHTRPVIPRVNTEVFRQAAGLPFGEAPINTYIESIAKTSPLASLDCYAISEPDALIGALDPAYPMVACSTTTEVDRGLYRIGCMMPGVMRYVVYREGKFQSIGSREEFQALYAPITSENEALSYAIALTGDEAKYGLDASAGYRIFMSELEDTHVVKVDNGYQINLYEYSLCGCGPHPYKVVNLVITTDGSLIVRSRGRAFEDPKDDGLCVD